MYLRTRRLTTAKSWPAITWPTFVSSPRSCASAPLAASRRSRTWAIHSRTRSERRPRSHTIRRTVHTTFRPASPSKFRSVPTRRAFTAPAAWPFLTADLSQRVRQFSIFHSNGARWSRFVLIRRVRGL